MDLDTTKDFERLDENKGALVNKNIAALEKYKKMKRRFSDINKIEQLENKVDRLSSLVEKLLEKIDDR